MTIDLGDNPVGNRPTITQKTQIRASIGCSQAPFLIGNANQLVDDSNSFLKNSESKFAFQVGAVNSLNFNDAANVNAIVNLNVLYDKNTITSINGIEPSLLGLDASNCTGINQSCTFNQGQLYNLNFSGCNNLPSLICTDNALTGLNVAGCTKLTTLNCSYNQLASLNISGLTGLTSLNCEANQLASLNLAGLTGLTNVNCITNYLTGLNISECTNLTSLYCQNNELTAASVNNILITLSGFGKSNGNLFLQGGSNAAPTTSGISAKTYLIGTKGWTLNTN
jgi:hypothetical protein